MEYGGGAFSPEEVEYLKTLPAVADATSRRITYTEEFKRDCVARYLKGASPVRMFREAGMPPSLVGYKRIECAMSRWSRNEKLRKPLFNAASAVKTEVGRQTENSSHDVVMEHMLLEQLILRINGLEELVANLDEQVAKLNV